MADESPTPILYTRETLGAERPRGEVRVQHEDGNIYRGFVCHGCQSCWILLDDEKSIVGEAYPHFLSWEKEQDGLARD